MARSKGEGVRVHVRPSPAATLYQLRAKARNHAVRPVSGLSSELMLAWHHLPTLDFEAQWSRCDLSMQVDSITVAGAAPE